MYIYTFHIVITCPRPKDFHLFLIVVLVFPLVFVRTSFVPVADLVDLVDLSQSGLSVLLKPLVLLMCLCSSCLCFPGAVPVPRCVVWRLFYKFLSLYLATLMYVWLVHVDSGCPFSPVDIAPHPPPHFLME